LPSANEMFPDRLNAVCGNTVARDEVEAQGVPRLALSEFNNEIVYSFRAEQILTLNRCSCNSSSNDSIEGLKSKIATLSQHKLCWRT
jgi:hypothetical protein